MKIIQMMFTPNDDSWQGRLIGLGDDSVIYEYTRSGWEVIADYKKNNVEKANKYLQDLLLCFDSGDVKLEDLDPEQVNKLKHILSIDVL